MAIELLRIDWTKLQPFTQVLTQAESQEGGLYAMFRLERSVINLYYIGKSIDFYKRSSTHMNYASHLIPDKDIKKYSVTFGIISSFEQSRLSHSVSPEQLKDAESFYINFYKPIGNSESTKKGYKGHTIISFNTGKCFQKHKVISNSDILIKFLKFYKKNI